MSGPLQGIRVADLTHFMAGPVCTSLLRDLGAEVIKVEPLQGEAGRYGGAYPTPYGERLTFQVHNRGKMSTTVDLKTEEGKALFRDLIRVSDACVENFRPGVMARLGIGYEDLKKINPTIVLASISGFGQSGPYSQLPCVDFIAQAMSGLMSLNGQPGDPPTKYGVEMADYSGGMFGALSVAAALCQRAMSGRSEHIDVGMLDAMVYQLNYHPIRYKFADLFYQRIGNRVAGAGVSGAYPCKDGHIVIAGGGDANWQRLTKVIGHAELADDPRYARTPKRWENHDELDVLIEEWSRELTVDEALAALREEDLVVGPVRELPDIFEDEHLKAREMLVEVEHPLHGALTVPGPVPKLRNSKLAKIDAAAPLVAEHNGYVVSELLGRSTQELRSLEENEVIFPKVPGALAQDP